MPEKIELRKLVMCFTASFKVLLSCKWCCFISRINLFEDHRSNFFFFFHCQRPWPFCWWLFLTASSIFYSFDSVEMWWSMWSSSTFTAREGKPSRAGLSSPIYNSFSMPSVQHWACSVCLCMLWILAASDNIQCLPRVNFFQWVYEKGGDGLNMVLCFLWTQLIFLS